MLWSGVTVGSVNDLSVPRQARSRAHAIILLALALCAVLVVTTFQAAAAYDPGRPSSSTGKGGSNPPGDGSDPPGDGPTRRVALGLARPDAAVTAVDTFTSQVGKKPAIWVLWSQWGHSGSKSFPTADANALRSRNIQPMIWWEPVDPTDTSDPAYPRHKNITAGNHDAYIRQFARDAKAFGGTVLMRFAQEANNNYFPWSVNSFDNSPTTFKNAWRHVVDIFRAEGADNVRWVWSVAKKTCTGGCNPYTEVYPGNDYVDVMAFSGYNWGAHPGKQWTSMYDSYRRVTDKLREVSNKPIMVAETASNELGGDKAQWIRDGYREVYRELPDIEAIVYLDADLRNVGHPDWRIDSPAEALVAYAEIANLARFDTRSPFAARVDIKATVSKDQAKQKSKDKARNKQAKKARVVKSEPKKKQPQVSQGGRVDEKSKDTGTSKQKNKRTKKPSKKGRDPVQVVDLFTR
jgi:beta-mannanase